MIRTLTNVSVFLSLIFYLGIYIKYKGMIELEKIVSKFKINGNIVSINPLISGLVNKTYLVTTTTNKYLLQKINKYVFKNPVDVMENIDKITKHLKEKTQPTLNIVRCNDMIFYYDDKEDEYYRMYEYMENCCNVDEVDNKISIEVGKAISKFQCLLFDYNPEELVETIHNFHHLSSRIKQLNIAYNSLKDDDLRKIESNNLYNYIMKEYLNNLEIERLIETDIIPIRVVHNDTKINNIMFDSDNKKAVAMIDLDTVMPGTILYDFGDVIRSTVSNSDENEINLDKVYYNDSFFTSLTAGYLSNMYNKLTYDEVKELTNSVGVITLECATRFLTDYLNKDVYFRIEYPKHNLNRAYNQITLYKDFLKKKKKWNNIVYNLYNRFILNI